MTRTDPCSAPLRQSRASGERERARKDRAAHVIGLAENGSGVQPVA